MQQDPGKVKPLDWYALVRETVARRHQEGLTQKEHAALAGVSVPTLRAFDRFDTGISIGKVLAILDVVGLRTESPPPGGPADFAKRFEARWSDLCAPLPERSKKAALGPRMIFQWACHGVEVQDDRALSAALRRAHGRRPIKVPPQAALRPSGFDGALEFWPAQTAPDLQDADALIEFWRADRHGNVRLQQGYKEDATEGLPPYTILDLVLPIRRAAEAVAWTDAFLRASGGDEATLAVRFEGLTGRELRAWINPYHAVEGVRRARKDYVESTTTILPGDASSRAPAHVARIVRPLHAAFDLYEAPGTLVEEETMAAIRAWEELAQ